MMRNNELRLRRQLLRAAAALEVLNAYIPNRTEAIENLLLIRELRKTVGSGLLRKAQ